MRGRIMSLLIVLVTILTLQLPAFGAEPIRMKYALSSYADEKGNGLNQPEGIACKDNRLVVADTGNGRLVLYSLEGGEPKGGKEIKLPQIVYPIRVKINSKGDIFVLDERQRKVVHLTPEGAFKQYLELGGLPTESMVVPAGIDIDGNDNIYLLDILGGRVLVLDADGKITRQISFPKEYGFITDLAVNSKGIVFLTDGVKSMVYANAADPGVFSPITGIMKEDLKFPSNIVADAKGLLFISDQNSGGIVAVGQDGTFRNRMLSLGWTEGTVRYPTQLCVDKDGDLFVADRANSRIQEFTPVK
jgi:DNA-binding beta-propeller fold protein YncE